MITKTKAWKMIRRELKDHVRSQEFTQRIMKTIQELDTDENNETVSQRVHTKSNN